MLSLLKQTLKNAAVSSASSVLRRLVSQNLPNTEHNWRCLRPSYAQFGEDILILAILSHLRLEQRAYYVDVGAFDPTLYSNTYRLHQQGWVGINIDPNPTNIRRFKATRPHDSNLEIAISTTVGEADFLQYESGTTGRLAGLENSDKSILGESPVLRYKVKTQPLSQVLQTFAPKELEFGLLTVDCEGADLDVLRSNDWRFFRPWVIAVEDHDREKHSDVAMYLNECGYTPLAQAFITKIFCRHDLVR